MSAETLTDHVMPLLESTHVVCTDSHTEQIAELLGSIQAHRAALRGWLGATVHPSDLRASGSALTTERLLEGSEWRIGEPDSARLQLEGWAVHEDRAVRVMAEKEWHSGHSVAPLLVRHEDGKMPWLGLGSEAKRVKTLATWALGGRQLTVHEFDTERLTQTNSRTRAMDALRRGVEGSLERDERVIKLYGAVAIAGIFMAGGRADGTIRVGEIASLQHFFSRSGTLYYTAPGIAVADVASGAHDIGKSDKEGDRAIVTSADRELVRQHAVHNRLHQLDVVIGGLYHARTMLEQGGRIRPEGRMLKSPVMVPAPV